MTFRRLLGSPRTLDVLLCAAFGLVALAVLVAGGRSAAAVAVVDTTARVLGRRHDYVDGLLVGLAILAGGLLTSVGLATLLIRRRRAAAR